MKKTTAKLYFDCYMSRITNEISYFDSLKFYGPRSTELNIKLKEFIDGKVKEFDDRVKNEKAKVMALLFTKLLNTEDGWFKKPSRKIKQEIRFQKSIEPKKHSGLDRLGWYLEFLTNPNAVKMFQECCILTYEIPKAKNK